MKTNKKPASIGRLHQALRENRSEEALCIAHELHEIYQESNYPDSLRAFVQSVIAEGQERPELKAQKTWWHSWHALPGANMARMREVLSIWNQLHPGSQNLYAPGDQQPSRMPAERLAYDDLRRLLIGAQGSLPLLDAWFVSSHQLRLRVGAAPAASGIDMAMYWQFFQWEPVGQLLAKCGSFVLDKTTEGLYDLQMVQPFSPLLMLRGDGARGVAELSLLPFPSLLRHGVHHGELMADMGERASSEALSLYSLNCLWRLLQGHHPRVRSWNIRNPEGSPGGWVSRPSVQYWLAQISAVESQVNVDAHTSLHLDLDGDGLPSIRSLTGLTQAPKNDIHGEAAFVLVDPCSLQPILQLRPGRQPSGIPSSIRLEKEGEGRAPLRTPDTVAIKMAIDSSPRRRPLWWPTERAAKSRKTEFNAVGLRSLEVVFTEAPDQDDLQFSLWGLNQQKGIRINQIWLPPRDGEGSEGTEALLGNMQKDGIKLKRSGVEGLDPLLEGCRIRGTLLLLIKAGVCLHEPATLSILSEMLHPQEVASASCLLIHERQLGKRHSVEASSCGLMPGLLDPLHNDRMNLVQQTLQEINAIDDRSVIANLSDLVLVDPNQRHWQPDHSTPAGEVGLQQQWLNASLSAILQGSLHVATPEVSAHYRRAPRRDCRFYAELTGTGLALNRAIPQLLAASTCCRRLG